MRLPTSTFSFALVSLVCTTTQASKASPSKFLLVSAPRDAHIGFAKITSRSGLRRGQSAVGEVQTLIERGLVHPQGIAVDQRHHRLLVADPDSKKIFSYSLKVENDALVVGPQIVAAENIEARWVAVDGFGALFFSDETQNKIFKIPLEHVKNGVTTPTVAFDGSALTQVSAPGGVATDSFSTFWVNKQIGSQVGSLVRASGPAASTASSSGRSLIEVQALASNTDKSYGVCLSSNNVFYTQPEQVLYGAKKTGKDAKIISDHFMNPRGCAWDGDGTVYVADRGAGAIYSFAGNMKDLSLSEINREVTYEDAFGVAVFSGCWRARLSAIAAATAAVVLLAWQL